MRIYKNIPKEAWPQLCLRPAMQTKALEKVVNEVFDEVRQKGDEALKAYTNRFDGVDLSEIPLNDEEWLSGLKNVPKNLKEAIKQAKGNIELFHKAQLKSRISVETEPGVNCWQEERAIQKVGIYIPGGTAPLFSTVLMLAIPAKLAGCEDIILCTPPDKSGQINPAVLYAAKITGVDKIMKLGGIQAIAALTYGTESVPKVFKIFGPGNQFVAAAKQKALSEGLAIDLPAGPSEVLVVTDDTAEAAFVASDLLSQAEHGADSQVVCISNSFQFLEAVNDEIEKQLETLPRATIARESLKNARFLFSGSKEESIGFINEYAPEHLIIASADEAFYIDNLKNAGSVFLGNYAPESAGDYASGTNHTLPTNGFARNYGSLSLDDFTKKMSFQKLSRQGLQKIGKSIILMARAEGLEAHAQAVEIRLKKSGL